MKPTTATPTTPAPTETPAPATGLVAYMDEKFREAGMTEDAPSPGGEPGEDSSKVPAKPKAKVAEVDPDKVTPVDDFTSLEDSGDPEEGEEGDLEVEDGEEDPEADDDEVPDSVKKQGEKAVTTWGELKKAKSEAVRTAKALEAKVKDLETKLQKTGAGDSDAEITTLRERVAEQERIIAATNVVESAEYREAVTAPLDAYGKTVQELVDDPQVVGKIFDAFAAKTVKERLALLSEATEDMPELVRHEIYDISKKVAEVWAKEQLIKDKAVQAKAEIDRNTLTKVAKETEAEKQTRLAAADKIWKNTQEKIPAMFGEDGDLRPEFAEIGAQGREVSITEASLGTQVFAGYAVKLVPLLAKEVAARDKEISTLQTQITRLTGASTKVKSGSGSSPGASPAKPMRAVDAINERFRQAGM